MPIHFAGQHYRVSHPVTPVQAEPNSASMRTSEALYGELLCVLAIVGEWCHVRLLKDSYQGFLASQHLNSAPVNDKAVSTHWVSQRSTLLFSQPDIKSQLLHRLPFGAELTLTPVSRTTFSQTSCGHYVWTVHCLPKGTSYPASPSQLAQRIFLGTPYLWGGRSPAGIDCSGLVQALAYSQGHAIPRDSADQENFLTTDIMPADYQAQDIVFWPGHTGILISPTELLHATAHTLSCVLEPLQAVIDRVGPVSSVKRLFKD